MRHLIFVFAMSVASASISFAAPPATGAKPDPNSVSGKGLVWLKWRADIGTIRKILRAMKPQLRPTKTVLEDGSGGKIRSEILHVAHYRNTYLVFIRRSEPDQPKVIWAYEMTDTIRNIRRVGTEEWINFNYRGLVRLEKGVSKDIFFIHFAQGIMTAPHLSSMYFDLQTGRWKLRRWGGGDETSILLDPSVPDEPVTEPEEAAVPVDPGLTPLGKPSECRYRVGHFIDVSPNQLAVLCRQQRRFPHANYIWFAKGERKTRPIPESEHKKIFETLKNIPAQLQLVDPADDSDFSE